MAVPSLHPDTIAILTDPRFPDAVPLFTDGEVVTPASMTVGKTLVTTKSKKEMPHAVFTGVPPAACLLPETGFVSTDQHFSETANVFFRGHTVTVSLKDVPEEEGVPGELLEELRRVVLVKVGFILGSNQAQKKHPFGSFVVATPVRASKIENCLFIMFWVLPSAYDVTSLGPWPPKVAPWMLVRDPDLIIRDMNLVPPELDLFPPGVKK